MQSAKFRAVTFDAGGTLIEPWPSVGHVYATIARRHGFIDPDHSILNRDFARAWGEKNDFDYSRDAWRQIVCDSFRSQALPVSDAFFDELFEFFATPAAWRIHDDVIPTLDGLRARRIRLAVISNWDHRLRPLLARLKLDQYFEVIGCSCELGFTKPSREIFVETLVQLRLQPGEVLHVGDSRREDFDGARNAGLHALHLQRNKSTPSDLQLNSLSEILTRIGI